MMFLTVFICALNFLLFASTAGLVRAKYLIIYTITSMAVILLFLLASLKSVIAGQVKIATLGV
jgi:hypothetical protein